MNDDAESIPLAAGEHPPVPGAVKLASRNLAAHHSARTKARKAALDALFEADLLGGAALEALSQGADAGEPTRPFTRELVQGVALHGAEIDQRIAECASGDWTLERMPRIDRNLARIAVYELDYTDVESSAPISEAVGLAEEYSTDNSASFLNGLLGRAAATRLCTAYGRTPD